MGELFSKHFTLEKVSRNVYVAVAKEGSGSVANAGIVDLGENVLVFDTFNTQQASEDLKYIAEKVTNQPVGWVLIVTGMVIIFEVIKHLKEVILYPVKLHIQK